MNQIPVNTLLTGDCSVLLRDFPSDILDLVVTDPPYGLEFMGKDWDKAVPSVEIWKQCLRALKPGAFAFVMSSPRLDCLAEMSRRLQEAGFRIDFSPIAWCYASGFPKAENISLGVDKRECRRQLAEKLGRTPTKDEFTEAWKEFRKVVGKKQHAKNFEGALENKIGYLADPANAKNKACFGYGVEELTVPETKEAKLLDGAYGGFQPKPAWETIIVAMKPLSERTYVDQALKNKKGVTWLDDARVPFHSQEDASTAEDNSLGPAERSKTSHPIYEGGKSTMHASTFSERGRFPANLLVSDDALNDGTIRKSTGGAGEHSGNPAKSCYGKYEHYIGESAGGFGDVGSFSRYFDLDIWFDKQLEKLPESVRRTFPFLIVPKASRSEREEGLDLPKQRKYYDDGRGQSHDIFSGRAGDAEWKAKNPANPTRNIHPTVKPLKLMSYLVTLGSREGDVVLDPFAGSGTTCIAAHMLNRKWIGIEIDPEYTKIAQARLKTCLSQEKLP